MAVALAAAVLVIYAWWAMRPTAPPPGAPLQGFQLRVEPVPSLKLVVLVDNNPYNGLRSPWGISVHVEAGGRRVLFDTGPDPATLEENAKRLGVNLSEIDAVVISHEHGDHVGGLPAVARAKPGATVYIPKGFSPRTAEWIKGLGLKVVEVEGPAEIYRGIATTGPFRGPPPEQALIIRVEGLGLVVVTGCAHPGIEEILRYAYNLTRVHVYAVVGGFHLIGASASRLQRVAQTMLELGVDQVYPLHCTGDRARAYLAERLGERYMDGHVGITIEYGP